MELEEFKKAVMLQLPTIPDERDYAATERGIARLHEDGFTVSQARRYCLCTEEVSPELDEDTALRIMHNIYEEVKRNRANNVKGK